MRREGRCRMPRGCCPGGGLAKRRFEMLTRSRGPRRGSLALALLMLALALVGSRGGGVAAQVPLPTDRVPDPHVSGVVWFAATGHTLRGTFLKYWNQFGGLAQFGYPITEEF